MSCARFSLFLLCLDGMNYLIFWSLWTWINIGVGAGVWQQRKYICSVILIRAFVFCTFDKTGSQYLEFAWSLSNSGWFLEIMYLFYQWSNRPKRMMMVMMMRTMIAVKALVLFKPGTAQGALCITLFDPYSDFLRLALLLPLLYRGTWGTERINRLPMPHSWEVVELGFVPGLLGPSESLISVMAL